MEISVRREAASGSREPVSSTLLRLVLGDLCVESSEECLVPKSWNLCAELDTADLRRGFAVLLEGREGCVGVSTSSTSKDLFKVGLVGSEIFLNLPLGVLAIPVYPVLLIVSSVSRPYKTRRLRDLCRSHTVLLSHESEE